jgi:hypothetical protein
MFVPGQFAHNSKYITPIDPQFADPETSGEETKVRLRWPRCQQARHSSEEAEKVVYEQLRTSLCIAGSDADKHNFAISTREQRQSLAKALHLLRHKPPFSNPPNSNPISTTRPHIKTYLFARMRCARGASPNDVTDCTQSFFFTSTSNDHNCETTKTTHDFSLGMATNEYHKTDNNGVVDHDSGLSIWFGLIKGWAVFVCI